MSASRRPTRRSRPPLRSSALRRRRNSSRLRRRRRRRCRSSRRPPERPLSRIKGALDTAYPGNGVTFDNQGETIVLSGTVRSGAVAEEARRLALQQVNNNPTKVLNNIRIDAPTQVQLRVKVAEVKRDALK